MSRDLKPNDDNYGISNLAARVDDSYALWACKGDGNYWTGDEMADKRASAKKCDVVPGAQPDASTA